MKSESFANLMILAIVFQHFGKIKGQLISEGLFSFLNSSKKTQDKIRLRGHTLITLAHKGT